MGRLSSYDLERITRIINKYSDPDTKKLVNYLTETKDKHRMLIFMEKLVSSSSQYDIILSKILKNNFIKDLANTIDGKPVKLFFNTTDDTYKYYSKLKNNQYLFAKVVGNEALLITFDVGANITISTAQTKSKDYVVNFLKLEVNPTNDN